MSPADLSKLKDMVAEHLDNLYYLNDILCLKVHAINEVLTAQVIKKLLVPLYLHSLIPVYALELNDQVRRALSCRAMWSMAADHTSCVRPTTVPENRTRRHKRRRRGSRQPWRCSCSLTFCPSSRTGP